MNLQGWRITTLVTCLIVVGLLFNFGLAGWNAPAIHQAIDATGRSSLIFFAVAYTSSSLESLWPSSLSRWTLRNRRWIGLSFASSHFIHLGLIVSMTVFVSGSIRQSTIHGSVGVWWTCLWVCVFDGTHFNRSGPTLDGNEELEASSLCWSHWIWVLFLLTYMKHVKEGPLGFYLPFLVFTLALIPIRYAKHILPKAPLNASM